MHLAWAQCWAVAAFSRWQVAKVWWQRAGNAFFAATLLPQVNNLRGSCCWIRRPGLGVHWYPSWAVWKVDVEGCEEPRFQLFGIVGQGRSTGWIDPCMPESGPGSGTTPSQDWFPRSRYCSLHWVWSLGGLILPLLISVCKDWIMVQPLLAGIGHWGLASPSMLGLGGWSRVQDLGFSMGLKIWHWGSDASALASFAAAKFLHLWGAIWPKSVGMI